MQTQVTFDRLKYFLPAAFLMRSLISCVFEASRAVFPS
jgi:hypothetical protein